MEETKQKNVFMQVVGHNPTFSDETIKWLDIHSKFKTREKIYNQNEKIKSDLDKFIRCINFPSDWEFTLENFDKFKRNLIDDMLNLSESIKHYMVSAERIIEQEFYEEK